MISKMKATRYQFEDASYIYTVTMHKDEWTLMRADPEFPNLATRMERFTVNGWEPAIGGPDSGWATLGTATEAYQIVRLNP